MTDAQQWVEENMGGMLTRYPIRRLLYEEQTPFQRMRLIESEPYGRMLLLDDYVQLTEKDEFVYHEMMTHVPMLAHGNPRHVLVIGGGDGGILREVCKHPGVEHVTLAEIDGRVIEFSKAHLPSVSNGAFDDPRVEICVGDGAAFVKNTTEKYDVVIVDSSDPVGPAQVLFSKEFYTDIRNALAPGGVMVRQTGSTFLQPDEQKQAMEILSGVFEHAALYLFNVPTYVGGLFSCVFASDTLNALTTTVETLQERAAATKLAGRYYSPKIHVAAFELPGYVRENIAR
ncbi:TPA: polyamine aminopropyltransferase [Candidatus Sumerlaeota bacterium]|jgi:spermidine synthase|nr:polyamine aminopropyltransferase [Candidatus Sumerlaeota bacterium]